MNLYVWRHGIAEDYHPDGDSKRNLTDKGSAKVGDVARFLKGKIKPAVILSSPYVRALQTAEIIAEVFNPPGGIEKSGALFPGTDPAETFIELAACREDEVLITGHNPHLSMFASAALDNGYADLNVKKSSVLCFSFSKTIGECSGVLNWFLTPGVLGI